MVASPAYALLPRSLVPPAPVVPQTSRKEDYVLLHKNTGMAIAAISAGLSAWKS